MNLGKISSFAVSGDVVTLVMQSKHKSFWRTIGLDKIARFPSSFRVSQLCFSQNRLWVSLKPAIAKTNTCTSDDVMNISRRRSSTLGGDDGSAFVIEWFAIRRQHNSDRRQRTISWSNVLRGFTHSGAKKIFFVAHNWITFRDFTNTTSWSFPVDHDEKEKSFFN